MSDLIWGFRERLMNMSVNNRVALGLRLFTIGLGMVLVMGGRPPARAQVDVEGLPPLKSISLTDEHQNNQISRMEEWHIEQAGTNAATASVLKDQDTRIRYLENLTSDLNGELKGGVGFITILTGLAVFFQLKRKVS